jgi:diguanylate cyclase (GGDEF)-like protein
MDKHNTTDNKRILFLAITVICIATFSILIQLRLFLNADGTIAGQAKLLLFTAILHMGATLALVLQKLKNSLSEARNLAYADELTGLINRRKFYEMLNDNIEKRRLRKEALGVLILDLDGFKMINDCHGHDAGDQTICQFGERLKKIAPPSSVICRMSGDEFAIMMDKVESEQEIHNLCDAILKEMKKPFTYEGKKINAGVSIGATLVSGFEDEYLAPLRMADYALLQSKQKGRNQAHLFNYRMAAQIKRKQNLEAAIRDAISTEILSLKYQPFVNREDNSITGVEALVRWNHPIEGEVLPSEFLPVAQELGLLPEIGGFILERACKEVKPLNGIRLAINISSAQFMQNEFVDQVRLILNKTGFEPTRLELEICQNLLTSNSEKVRSDLKELKELGIQIVLDDFGTSYSSMFFLGDFTLDRIKLDRSFVNNMRTQKDGDKIINNMIALGSTLSERLTVEGIETKSQLDTIHTNGAEDLQGFFFSKPMSIEELQSSKMMLDLQDKTAEESGEPKGNLISMNFKAG